MLQFVTPPYIESPRANILILETCKLYNSFEQYVNWESKT